MITELTVQVNGTTDIATDGVNFKTDVTTRLLELSNVNGLTAEDIVGAISFLRGFIRDGRNVYETTDEDKTQDVDDMVMRGTDGGLVSDLI